MCYPGAILLCAAAGFNILFYFTGLIKPFTSKSIITLNICCVSQYHPLIIFFSRYSFFLISTFMPSMYKERVLYKYMKSIPPIYKSTTIFVFLRLT